MNPYSTEGEKNNGGYPQSPQENSVPPPYPYPQGNPYNQLPPGNVGFLPPNLNSTNDAVMAAQAVNTAIHQNGRTPLTVVCPTCKNLVVTEISEVQNTGIIQGQRKTMHIFFAGTLVVILSFFIATTVISGSYIPLGVMPVFLLFIGVGYFMMRSASRNAANMCTDIQHHCSSCKVLLGVSSGAQFLQQMQIANNMNRRHRHFAN